MKKFLQLSAVLLFSLTSYAQPLLIKGICYEVEHPINYSNLKKDIELLKQANVNTLLIKEAIESEELLDNLWSAGISIITLFPYSDIYHPCLENGSYLLYIKKYKHHPAICMWGIGCGINYQMHLFEGKINTWHEKLNAYAQATKNEDSIHPVTCVYGGMPAADLVTSHTSIDVWGVMVFHKDDVSGIIQEWTSTSSKPMFLVSGIDSYNNSLHKETRSDQAKGIKNLLLSVFGTKQTPCLGIFVHSFADNHSLIHSAKQEYKGLLSPEGKFAYDGVSDVEYFGIVTKNRRKKNAYRIVSDMYKSN